MKDESAEIGCFEKAMDSKERRAAVKFKLRKIYIRWYDLSFLVFGLGLNQANSGLCW